MQARTVVRSRNEASGSRMASTIIVPVGTAERRAVMTLERAGWAGWGAS